MFDPNKPVELRNGQKARILATDVKNDRPIVIAIENNGTEFYESRYSDGSAFRNQSDHPLDLVNTPDRTEQFINVYSLDGYQGVSTTWRRTLGSARSIPTSHSKGIIKVVFEDGVPVSCELVK